MQESLREGRGELQVFHRNKGFILVEGRLVEVVFLV